ncbi:hypothetical protein PYCCODRAFT_1474457 [Trametes coccinea BRFM310]|uniref:Telomere replication protein EST3 n=1 Tax=Trametes coccinea (strain BRFM310) TaxID=1353009 RepID=A0A1Y2J122_TRAC3|nr:hypothetical protein PYCCODRAFT_1474457 [Trametes coccinea BRFM310]
MSEVIRSPWILDYLISVAETYGGDLSSVPRSEKRRKAQFVKFLTFPPADSQEPCMIWVDVSDEKHLIHARLSPEAMQRYMQNPANMGPITALRSALVRLGRFRPAFARVALRDPGGGMTKKPRLYLDVDEFDLLGSFGEPMWGSPVDIAQDVNIREWMEGLRQDGGGGNVLKLKKQRLAALAAQQAQQLQGLDTHHQTTIDSAELKVRVARKSAAHKGRPSGEAVRQGPVASREAIRKASWRRLHTNMMKYFRPPDEIYQQLMQLSEAEDEQTYEDDTNGQDISMVEASIYASEHHVKAASESMDVDTPSAVRRRSSPSTSSQMPPSAQPRLQIPPSSIPTLPHASSSPRQPSPMAQERPQTHTNDIDTLPPSSFPASTYHPPSPTSSPRRVPETPAYPVPAVRRVPPPQCRVLRRDPDASGEGRVLVENSDTASPGSHRFSQSQNQSHSQSQGGGESQSQTGSHGATRSGEESSQGQGLPPSQPLSQPYSQPQRPSQLRTELEPAEVGDEQHHHGGQAAKADEADTPVEAADTSVSQQEAVEQGQNKSQQSLSYKGDSQSQENPPPVTGAGQPEQEAARPERELQGNSADLTHTGERAHRETLGEGIYAVDPAQPVEPEPSPMAVDTSQEAIAAAGPVGDAAPAWVTIDPAEDSDDSPAEVDELISDPPLETRAERSEQNSGRGKALQSDSGKARTREELGRDATTSSRRTDLDSDDERTAAMVDQSEFLAKVSKVIAARSRSAASDRSSPERKGGSVVTKRSPPPRGPVKSTRAVETDDARASTEVEVTAKPRLSGHDPSIWYAPTFMRTAAVSKAVSSRGPAKTVVEVPLASRAGKRKATLPPPEASPTKKRKTVASSSSSTTAVTSLTKGRPASSARADIGSRQSIASRRDHTSDFVQGSSTSAHLSSRKSPAAMPAPPTNPSETEHRGSGVKYVDLRTASRSSSRASSRTSGKYSAAGVSRNSSATIPRRDSIADSNATGASSSRSHDSLNSGPPPPASRTISSTSLADLARLSRSTSGTSSSTARVRAALRAESHPEPASMNPAGPSRVRSAGYGLSLEQTRTPGGPPLLSWAELLDILFKTGRERYKEQKKRDEGGSA